MVKLTPCKEIDWGSNPGVTFFFSCYYSSVEVTLIGTLPIFAFLPMTMRKAKNSLLALLPGAKQTLFTYLYTKGECLRVCEGGCTWV